jgi:hypothetical protein
MTDFACLLNLHKREGADSMVSVHGTGVLACRFAPGLVQRALHRYVGPSGDWWLFLEIT